MGLKLVERDHLRLVTNKLSQEVEEVKTANARLGALIEASQQLSLERDASRLVESYCGAARDVIGAAFAGIGILEDGGREIRQLCLSGLDDETAVRIGAAFGSTGVVGEVLQGRVCRRRRNRSGDPAALGLPPAHPPVYSFLGAPILTPARTYGWLCLCNKLSEEAFSDEDERLAAALAAQLAVAYENARLYEELKAERGRMEAALDQSEKRLQAILDNTTARISLKDPQGRFLLVNRALETVLHATSDEITGKTDHDFFPKPIADGFQANDQKVLEARSPMEFEEVVLQSDGPHTYISVKFPLCDSQGAPFAVGEISTDITARKRAEEEMRLSASKYRMLVEQASDGIALFDAQANCIEANPKLCEMLGYTRQELLQLNPRLPLPDEDWLADPATFAELLAGGAIREERALFRKDQTRILVEVSASRLEDGRLQAIIRDITERKSLEQQLWQAQKMEAVGRLAGGVAHDFNNLLTVIIGNCQLAMRDLDEANPLRRELQDILEAGARGAVLTNQLLAFSRKQVLQPRALDLNALVANLGKMLRRLIGEDIELITMLDPALGRVKADPGQLEQVILNLAVNARDAMPHGGKLMIDTANVDVPEGGGAYIGWQPGPYVMLAVSDTGCGMDRETQSHIFEPFFTTKEQGKGTGLGLSTVYGIVSQSGGHVSLHSEPAHGTTFRIHLPRIDEAAEPLPQCADRESLPQGTETVLLVEDDPVVRALAAIVLRGQGYKVLEASNGAEALRLAEEREETIHLLLTDVVMPKMSGKELAGRLRLLRPGIRVLYDSGYTDDAIGHRGVLDPATPLLPKPFGPAALTKKVREVLDRPPQREP